MQPFKPTETASVVTIKPVKTLWSYAIAVGAREQKDHSKCRGVGGSGARGQGGVMSYILKGCVQLYEQEGSLCTCVLGLQHNSLTLWPLQSGSGYWCLF